MRSSDSQAGKRPKRAEVAGQDATAPPKLGRMNPDLREHLDELQRACAVATPAARLRMIKQRLASSHAEMGATRLVTIVGAVEALARSLVVHSSGRPASTAEMRHRQFRDTGPLELVEEVLRLRGAPRGLAHFGAQAWELFEVATRHRDLIVHECSYVGQDLHLYLFDAADAVLRGLVELAGLEARPRAIT